MIHKSVGKNLSSIRYSGQKKNRKLSDWFYRNKYALRNDYRSLSSSRFLSCCWHRRSLKLNLRIKYQLKISFFTFVLKYFVWFLIRESSILMLLNQWILLTFLHYNHNNHQKVLNTKYIKERLEMFSVLLFVLPVFLIESIANLLNAELNQHDNIFAFLDHVQLLILKLLVNHYRY